MTKSKGSVGKKLEAVNEDIPVANDEVIPNKQSQAKKKDKTSVSTEHVSKKRKIEKEVSSPEVSDDEADSTEESEVQNETMSVKKKKKEKNVKAEESPNNSNAEEEHSDEEGIVEKLKKNVKFDVSSIKLRKPRSDSKILKRKGKEARKIEALKYLNDWSSNKDEKKNR